MVVNLLVPRQNNVKTSSELALLKKKARDIVTNDMKWVFEARENPLSFLFRARSLVEQLEEFKEFEKKLQVGTLFMANESKVLYMYIGHKLIEHSILDEFDRYRYGIQGARAKILIERTAPNILDYISVKAPILKFIPIPWIDSGRTHTIILDEKYRIEKGKVFDYDRLMKMLTWQNTPDYYPTFNAGQQVVRLTYSEIKERFTLLERDGKPIKAPIKSVTRFAQLVIDSFEEKKLGSEWSPSTTSWVNYDSTFTTPLRY